MDEFPKRDPNYYKVENQLYLDNCDYSEYSEIPETASDHILPENTFQNL